MTPRHRRFVEEYLIDLDCKHAAIRAGFGRTSAHNRGCQLLRRRDVKDAIAAAMAERARRTGITPERVLEELSRIAFVDWRKLTAWGPDGVSVADSRTLSPAEAAAVARVSIDDGWENRVAIATHDKQRALDTLSRILGLSGDAAKPGSSA